MKNQNKPFDSDINLSSHFVKNHQPMFVANKQWVPWGYDVDKQDPHLFHPDLRSLAILEKVFKYVYIGATYESAAVWVQHWTKRKISKPGVAVMYRKWLKGKTQPMITNRIAQRKIKKQEMEARLGRRIDVKGISEAAQAGPEEAHEQEAERAAQT